jgi:hypothetical protein
MYRTVRACDVCGRRFRIRCANQLRCSEKCKKKGEQRKAAEFNAKYQAAEGFRERYNARRRAWRKQNREREREKDRQYVEANRTRISRRTAEYQKKRRRKRQQIDSEYISEGTLKDYLRAYYRANRERLQEANREWRKRNPERSLESDRRWRRENRERVNARLADRRKRDPVVRLVIYVRNRITRSLRLAKASKTSSTHKYVGLTGPELMAYLLAHPNNRPRFTAENYGAAWHCDHIRPLASFDLADAEQAAAAFHYTNLQPMSAKENLSKGSLLDGQRHRYGKPARMKRRGKPTT